MKDIFKRKGKLIYIKQPEFNELNYVVELWADEDTMKDVGGAIAFPEEKRKGWYEKMVSPSDFKNFYCLIYNFDNQPVGEVSFHRFDEKTRTADFNIKVQAKYRGRGYGKEAMKLILKYYFGEFGGQAMYDEVINVKGQKALISFGFDIISRTENSIDFKLTKSKFDEIYEHEA